MAKKCATSSYCSIFCTMELLAVGAQILGGVQLYRRDTPARKDKRVTWPMDNKQQDDTNEPGPRNRGPMCVSVESLVNEQPGGAASPPDERPAGGEPPLDKQPDVVDSNADTGMDAFSARAQYRVQTSDEVFSDVHNAIGVDDEMKQPEEEKEAGNGSLEKTMGAAVQAELDKIRAETPEEAGERIANAIVFGELYINGDKNSLIAAGIPDRAHEGGRDLTAFDELQFYTGRRYLGKEQAHGNSPCLRLDAMLEFKEEVLADEYPEAVIEVLQYMRRRKYTTGLDVEQQFFDICVGVDALRAELADMKNELADVKMELRSLKASVETELQSVRASVQSLKASVESLIAAQAAAAEMISRDNARLREEIARLTRAAALILGTPQE
ncbi:hypothetical protein PHYSODRAFT_331339 [Phytophthora sojae]|uniref:Uncharacterized protein n=1 Tax=Phytophthora sojae (strain P6497) TaxID=1094619 RepID=G4ZDC4_PHYSP|nr:hypothetical protein PHYSODRAFT_331339 [Phytophthora sojae]EGZ17359.1 hypothetical protein PHYSODRAFT_331339 [Phytophthora sojae]|eukprot:XP_009526417.1 hypothetical protein PHYSODRAFT_331339 [Phytophthora sojae]